MVHEHHVVVVGGGFAGIACVKGLRRANVRITLVDQRNHHLFQPLLYQVATTILPTSEIAWPLRRLFKDRAEVTTLMATVASVDREGKAVVFVDGRRIEFDTLVIATGARHSYFGQDDWEAFAPGLKTLEDATTIRRRMLSAFEFAEWCDDPEERDAYLTFAVIGAGPTGVELAGIIAELAHRVLPSEFRRIDTRKARVLLIEAGPRVLPSFPDRLSRYVERALRDLGVEVMTGEPVTACDADGIVVAERRTRAKTAIWAAGIMASNAALWLDAEADRAGRTVVEPDLSVPRRVPRPGPETAPQPDSGPGSRPGSGPASGQAPEPPDVFVIGDTASVKDRKGQPVPGIAPAAKQQGAYVARVIARRLAGRPLREPFHYRHAGNLATVGRSAAVVDLGWLSLTGALAWWVWGIAHIYFLIGTRSRLAVAYSWLWSYVTGQNSARLITQGQAEGRAHSQALGPSAAKKEP